MSNNRREYVPAVIRFLLIVALLLFSRGSRADWLMLWHVDAQGKLSERWEGKVETEVKFRDGMSEFYDIEVMPWVAYCFNDWFKLGAGWRQLSLRKNTNVYKLEDAGDEGLSTSEPERDYYWEVEQRPLTDLMFTITSARPWVLSDRIRIEYRMIEGKDAYFRYRNRIRLAPPWEWTKAGIKPWVAWETYYEDSSDWEGSRWNRNRLYAGISSRISECVVLGCCYYWENLEMKDGASTSNNEIGFDISMVY